MDAARNGTALPPDDARREASLSRRSFLELSGGAGAVLAGGGLLTQAGRAYPAENRKKIRIGVVGGGFGAGFWWHEHPNCVVTGVTDLYPGRRAGLKSRYRCDKVYDSLEIMLKESRDIDAVAVFSGAPDHAKHVKMCLERGLHVVSAVPACTAIEEAQMLKEVKEKSGLRYMMAESSYYRQECIFARNLFREGGFGELFYSEVEYYHDVRDITKPGTLGFNPDGSRSWRWGYPPMWYPTHGLGFLVGVTRERIVKVSCLGWQGNDPAVRDHPLRENVYKNPFWSQTSLMLTNRDHICRANEFRRCVPYGERAQWFGDKATLYMENWGTNGNVQNVRGKGPGPAPIPQYWKSDMLPEKMRHDSGHGGSAVFISAEFINALVEDREPAIDLYESLAMTVPGIVAHQSAFKDGQQLAVPQFERPKT
jgi:predicted dehydrogenase